MTVTETIAEQVAPTLRGTPYRLLRINDETLRVHIKRGRVVYNLDIAYDRRLDLYNVAAHTLRNRGLDLTTRTFAAVYADQLATVIESTTGLRALGIR